MRRRARAGRRPGDAGGHGVGRRAVRVPVRGRGRAVAALPGARARARARPGRPPRRARCAVARCAPRGGSRPPSSGWPRSAVALQARCQVDASACLIVTMRNLGSERTPPALEAATSDHAARTAGSMGSLPSVLFGMSDRLAATRRVAVRSRGVTRMQASAWRSGWARRRGRAPRWRPAGWRRWAAWRRGRCTSALSGSACRWRRSRPRSPSWPRCTSSVRRCIWSPCDIESAM